MNCDFAVVVTLELELAEILRVMHDRRTTRLCNLICHVGTIEGFRIIVAQSVDKGSVCSALAASDLIREFNPKFIALLGIAAGFPNEGVELGNVIYADPVMGYEYSKVYDDHQESKPRTFRPHPFGQQVLQSDTLLQALSGNDHSLKFKPGKLASGNKVVASEDFRNKLGDVIGAQILALEMESEGVAQAALNFEKPFLVIKGISDYADNATKGYTALGGRTEEQKTKEGLEVKTRQQKAAEASVKAFVQLLRHCKNEGIVYSQPPEVRSSRPIDVLHRIQNYATRGELKSTTISKHSVSSPELGLKRGDETLVLTNSLATYDSTPPAVEEIRNNLIRGAKYSYFLPEDQVQELAGQKKYLLERLKDGLDAAQTKTLERNIRFYSITEECIYNYAIIIKNGALTGFWYIVSANPSNTRDPELVLLELDQTLDHELMEVFTQLKQSSNQARRRLGKSK